MSLEEIKTEMANLPPEEQDHLAAYLVHLRHQSNAGIRQEITIRNDDKDTANWLTVQDLKEKWKD